MLDNKFLVESRKITTLSISTENQRKTSSRGFTLFSVIEKTVSDALSIHTTVHEKTSDLLDFAIIKDLNKNQIKQNHIQAWDHSPVMKNYF